LIGLAIFNDANEFLCIFVFLFGGLPGGKDDFGFEKGGFVWFLLLYGLVCGVDSSAKIVVSSIEFADGVVGMSVASALMTGGGQWLRR
jgi:hypothetical protein